MNWLKKKIYNHFAELEKSDMEKEKNENVVTSNQSNGRKDLSNPENTSKKMSPKKKKTLIISVSIISALALAIGLGVYFANRPTSIDIKSSEITNISGSSDNVEVWTKGGAKYTIDSNQQPWSLYLGKDTFTVFLYAKGQSLPISFRIEVYKGPDGPTKIWINSNVDIDVYKETPPETPPVKNELAAPFINATMNWSVPPAPFNWFALISGLFPIIFFIFMIVLMWKSMKMQMGATEGGIFGMGKSGAQLAKSNVRFSDVAGIKEEKEELSEIVDYLKNPQKYAAMGARTPKGVILYGPPGTGKTLLAKAVAGEAGVSFLQISGSQFEDMLVGVGAKRVRDLFTKARKSAPAIIFIDEIDSVASKRGKNEFGGGLADQTINQLLAEMDGFNTSTGIVVIAATNRLDVLDEAILRPGRFDRHIQVNLPDIKEREEILKIHSRNKNISKKVSLYDIARRTPGFSGAQLENVLNEATLLAVRNNETTITVSNIDEAIDRVIAGPAKKSRVISEQEKKLIAYHEAGHALVGLYTPGTDVVQKITIIPRGQAAGYTMQTPEGIEKRIQSKQDLLDMVRMTLGGRAAEEVVFGANKITTGASNDLYKVTNVIRAMVMQLGMTKTGMTQFIPSEGFINPYQQQKLYSDTKAKEIDEMIESMIETEYNNAKNIIKKNRKELDLIVEALIAMETILKEDIDYIHKYKKLPQEALNAIKTKKQKPKNNDKKTDDKKSSKN